MKFQLADDIGGLWKRWSTRIQAAVITLAASWGLSPEEWRDAVPKWMLVALMAVFALATISAQAVKQKKPSPEDCNKDDSNA